MSPNWDTRNSMTGIDGYIQSVHLHGRRKFIHVHSTVYHWSLFLNTPKQRLKKNFAVSISGPLRVELALKKAIPFEMVKVIAPNTETLHSTMAHKDRHCHAEN